MRVAIRVDASAEIGTGHVRRMLSLSKSLLELGGEVCFVSRKLGIDFSGLLAPHGIIVHWLDAPTAVRETFNTDIPHGSWAKIDQSGDARETIEILERAGADRVIVDHYAFDARWHSTVSEAQPAPLMVIDDLADRELDASWVVDHNFHPDHAAKFEGRLSDRCELLAGPRFAMIDPLYAKAPRYEFSHKVGSIGIFMGGIDADGDLLDCLDALAEIGWSGAVEAVVTAHHASRDIVIERLSNWPHGHVSQDLPDLSAFFARHDIQIGAGGGAIWERCCIGPPTIGLVCAENQEKSIPFADDAGFLWGVGFRDDRKARHAALVDALSALIADTERRKAMHTRALQIVDGEGTIRLARRLIDG